MFIEIVTKREELISLNIKRIAFFALCKEGTAIFDVDGNQYVTCEDYTNFKMRIRAISC